MSFFLRLTLLFACLSLSAAAEVTGRQRVIIREKIEKIRGFELVSSREEAVTNAVAGKARSNVIIYGLYTTTGWRLYQNKQQVPVDAKGNFRLVVPILGRENLVEVDAWGPNDAHEHERIRVTINRGTGPAPILVFNPLLSFRVFPVYTFQDFGGFTTTVGFSWNPTYYFSRRFHIAGQLGLYLPLSFEGGFFPILDAELLFGWTFFRGLQLEAGGGVQNWVNFGGLVPTASVNLAYTFQRALFRFLLFNRAFIGYSVVPAENYTQNIRVGFGFIF